ncbi:MAG: hypothetical protein ABI680_07955 [Chthoniobacteraceae bacterium]
MKSPHIAFLLFTLIVGLAPGRAGLADDPSTATLDLTKAAIQHASSVKLKSGADTIAASSLYSYAISGTVTGSGAFSFIAPGTDLGEVFDNFESGFSKNLSGIIINSKGSLPFVVLSKKLKSNFQVSGVSGQVRATLKAAITKKGELFFSLSGVSITAFGIPVPGKISFDEGSTCIVTVPPGSNQASQPDILFSIAGEAVGSNVYNSTGANQTLTAPLKKKSKVKFNVLVQNDGTASDTILVKGPAGNEGITFKYKIGKQDVTDAVVDGTLELNPAEPGAGTVLKVQAKVKDTKTAFSGVITASSPDNGGTDTMGIELTPAP